LAVLYELGVLRQAATPLQQGASVVFLDLLGFFPSLSATEESGSVGLADLQLDSQAKHTDLAVAGAGDVIEGRAAFRTSVHFMCLLTFCQ
jgi:hypothetical protein